MSDRAKRAPNALAAVNGFVAVQRAGFAGLTARAGGSRVVASLLACKEPPSSTVRSRRSSGPRRWENDRKLSLRVQEIHKTTDGPPDVITLYANTVKDAGLTTQREYEIAEFVAPSGSAGPRTPRTSSASGPAATTSSPTAPAALASRDVKRARGPRPGEGSRRPSRCDRRKGAGDFVGAVKRAVEAARLDSHPSRVRCGARSLHRLGAWTWRPSSRRVSAVGPRHQALIAATGIRTNQTSLGPCAGSCPGAQTRALLRTRIGVRSPRCCSSCATVSQYAFATTRSSPLSAEQLARAHPVERRALVVLP